MKPIKTLRAFARLFAIVALLITYVSYYLIRSIFIAPTIERGFLLRRAFARRLLKVLNIKVEMKGQIIEGTAMYIINHRNLIDPVIIADIVDAYFLAKAEVESYPFLGKGAKMTGAIYVRRDVQDSRTAARQVLHETLKKGLNIGVYPEGTTGTEEFTIKFHKGSFMEAAKLQVPVVPIAMEYKNKSDLWMQHSTFRQFLIQFGKKTTYVKMEIHPAIISSDGTFLMEESQRLIDDSLKEMHKGWHQLWG